MLAVLLISIALIATAVTALLWALLAPRFRADARLAELDAYGYSGVAPAPAPSAGGRRRTPRALAEDLGGVLERALGGADDSSRRQQLIAAGLYDVTPRALAGYQALAAAGFGSVGLIGDALPFLPGPFFDTAFFAVMGWVLPSFWIGRRARRRLSEIDRALPDAIDLVVVALEAGQGFVQALDAAANQATGPLGEQLRLTMREQRLGLSMPEALAHLQQRAGTPAVQTFVRSVTQGERLGVSIGQIMRDVAHDMRLRRRQAAEEAAQKTAVKILFPLIFLILPALMIVILAPAMLQFGDIGR